MKYIPEYLEEIVELLKDIKDEIGNNRQAKIEKAIAPLEADIEYRDGAAEPKKKTTKKNADNK